MTTISVRILGKHALNDNTFVGVWEKKQTSNGKRLC